VFLGSRLWNYGIPSLKVGVLLFLRWNSVLLVQVREQFFFPRAVQVGSM
jgi:hypothetical protein